MKLTAFVGLCVLHAVLTLEINREGRNNRRESRKLFGGYRITPKYCKPTRKVTANLGGSSICMFNHECSQRDGQVVGACMDGFLFGACCQVPEGSVGELIDSHSSFASTPKSYVSSTIRPNWGSSQNEITLSGITQITESLLKDDILPTAQDDAMVQIGDVQDDFSTPGIKHPSEPENLIESYDDSNEINPSDFHKLSSTIPLEVRKTTSNIYDTTPSYMGSSPLLQISIANGPDLSTPPPTYIKPMFHKKPSRPSDNDKYVLIPTISHTVRPNKTSDFDSIVNIIQMLNQSSTSPSYAASTRKPPSTSYVFSLTPSKRPTTTSKIPTKKPSTSYVFSSTSPPPRTTTKSPTKRKPSIKRPSQKPRPSKPTPKPQPSSSTLYHYPPNTTKPPGYFIYSTTSRPAHSTFANSPEGFPQTTKKPPSTSYVFSSTYTKRPTMTVNTVSPGYSVYTSPSYDSSSAYTKPTSSSIYSSPPPTIIVLSPSTETQSIPSESSNLYTTSAPPKRRPVAQVTINNHVTHNLYSTEGPSPTVLITPKPSVSTIRPVHKPVTEFITSPIESETSDNDLINFPPVRNPNLNISASVYDDDITTPSFIEDEELDLKMQSFVNKIVEGLQEPFQGLKDVVYNKNSSVFVEQQTKKPTKKPNSTKKTTPRPISTYTRLTTKKPTTRRPSQSSTKRPSSSSTSKKPTPTKKVVATTISYIDSQTSTFFSDDYRHVCGIRPLVKTGRIVGGKGATFGEFPWQVLVRESTWLGLFTKNKCGGVLISSKYVMTAAHCQPGFLASLVAVFGEHDISGERESKRAVSRNVKRVIVHRQYDAATFENDLALLELEHPVPFDEHIVPICLPREGEDFTGRMATVTGWGRLKYGGGVPSVLQEVQVPIMENHVCQEMFRTAGHSKVIMDSFLCAGYANGQKDSCEGDSGGPLVLQRPDGRYQLAGTVSHGIKCAAPYLPGVYMRTAFYKPWIESVTGVH